MRAVLVEKFGGPEVLTTTDLAVPRPGPDEVSIDVVYAGVNFADLKSRSSGYRVASLPFQPGLEVSGRIREVGESVTGFRPGQEVAALTSSGGYAEVAVSPANTVFALPAGVPLRVAATLPTVLPTAHALLHEVGRLRAGDTVLIHSAAGAVGTVAGQLARHSGAAAVYGVVSSAAKADSALKAGYDKVFVGDDFDEDVHRTTGGRGVDLALDPVGGDTLTRTLEALTPFGRLVSYGNASGAAPWQLGQIQLAPGRSVSGFSILTLARTDPALLREISARAFQFVADGVVELPITAEFPLTEAAAAHRLIETRTTTGKLLLRVAD